MLTNDARREVQIVKRRRIFLRDMTSHIIGQKFCVFGKDSRHVELPGRINDLTRFKQVRLLLRVPHNEPILEKLDVEFIMLDHSNDIPYLFERHGVEVIVDILFVEDREADLESLDAFHDPDNTRACGTKLTNNDVQFGRILGERVQIHDEFNLIFDYLLVVAAALDSVIVLSNFNDEVTAFDDCNTPHIGEKLVLMELYV